MQITLQNHATSSHKTKDMAVSLGRVFTEPDVQQGYYVTNKQMNQFLGNTACRVYQRMAYLCFLN